MSVLMLVFSKIDVRGVSPSTRLEGCYICQNIFVDIKLPNGISLPARLVHGWYMPGEYFDLHINTIAELANVLSTEFLPMQIADSAVIDALTPLDGMIFSLLEEVLVD